MRPTTEQPAIHVLRRLPDGSVRTAVVLAFNTHEEALRRWNATPRFPGHTVFSLQLAIPGAEPAPPRPAGCEAIDAVLNIPLSLITQGKELHLEFSPPPPRLAASMPPVLQLH